ncbi:MAG: hypothetical protein OHK0029_27040 [Armatimonadaceae bacterium]
MNPGELTVESAENLAKSAAANMRYWEQLRHKDNPRAYALWFPPEDDGEVARLTADLVREDGEIWAWRRLHGAQEVATIWKAQGFSYVFPGALLAAQTANADTTVPGERALELREHPAEPLPADTISPWYGVALSDPKAGVAYARTLDAARQHPEQVRFLLAYNTDRLIGQVCLVFTEVAGLYDVAIVESERGNGWGTALIAGSLRWANRAGYAWATLQCNVGLQRFYARNGFALVGAVDAWRRQADPVADSAADPVEIPVGEAGTLRENFITALCCNQAETVRLALQLHPELLQARFPEMMGSTPLHLAAWLGYRSLVDFFLARGADRHATDTQFGSTPAGWARHGKHTEIAALLERA